MTVGKRVPEDLMIRDDQEAPSAQQMIRELVQYNETVARVAAALCASAMTPTI